LAKSIEEGASVMGEIIEAARLDETSLRQEG
jgi:hypothetical protein